MPATKRRFREIAVTAPKPLSPDDRALVTRVLGHISPEDATHSVEESGIKLLLNAIDFNALDAEIRRLSESRGGLELCESSNGMTLLRSLVDKIASIRSYGIKGKKRLYAGYADERKVKNRKEKVANRAQYYYALDNDFCEKNTEPEPSQLNTILCADSAEALRDYPDNSIDLIFTSPPYNFGLDYAANHDASHWRAYFDKLFAVFDQCVRVLKFGGRIAVNVQPLFSDYIPAHHIISNYFMSRKLIWKGEILWEKNNYNCKYTAWGSWKSPSNPYLKYTWEFIEVFAKGTLKKSSTSGIADITADEFKKWVLAKWSIAPERDMKKFDHPAMFPEELVARVLKLFSFRGDIVLDPFNGVGSTTVVAKKLGRRYVGIDISPQYCATARRRIADILL